MSRAGSMKVFDGSKRGWRDDLVRNGRGEVITSTHNLMLIFEKHSAFSGVFRYNEFANTVEIRKRVGWPRPKDPQFLETDATEITRWLGEAETFALNAKRTTVMEVVEAVAHRNRYHPVQEYLDGLTWDRRPRIRTMFETYFGAAPGDYSARVAEIFLVGAVARIYEPGVKVDTMVVFEGAQGAGKTRVTRELFSPAWYAEAMESPASKDFYQALAGKWGVEIAEMESFSKAEVNKVKQALSAQADTYRASYGRYAKSYPRQCVFVGTTNDDHYLRDPTGARRFLPVRVSGVKVEEVGRVRDQLWAEAVHRYRGKCDFWTLPKAAAVEQAERYMADVWEEMLYRYLESSALDGEQKPGQGLIVVHKGGAKSDDGSKPTAKPLIERGDDGKVTAFALPDLLYLAIGLPLDRQSKSEQQRAAHALRRLEWKRDDARTGSDRVRMWRRVKGGELGSTSDG